MQSHTEHLQNTARQNNIIQMEMREKECVSETMKWKKIHRQQEEEQQRKKIPFILTNI